LEAVTAEAVEVKALEERLRLLKSSSVLDKQSELDNLRSELQDKYEEEIKNFESSHEAELLNLRLTHESEMSKLKSEHDKHVALFSPLGFCDDLRETKAAFEVDKQNAVNEAIAQRAMEVMKLKQQLKSTSMELAEVKDELEAMKNRLKLLAEV
jgi:hypothetical protein